MIKFSKMEQAVMNVLQDGKPHKKQELVDSLDDELFELSELKKVILRIRVKLARARSEYEVIGEYYRRTVRYRLMRYTGSFDD